MIFFFRLLIIFPLTCFSYDVLGIGGACMDLIIPIHDNFLIQNKIEKGGSIQINVDDYLSLMELLETSSPRIAPGGSAANTTKGLAALGHNTAFFARIGGDEMGKKFTDHLYLRNVLSLLIPTENYTTQVISLVTPDGERTMRCLPGAGNDLTASDLHPLIFKTIKHVHFEGYALYSYELVENAMRMAKENGASISLDLASFEIVRRHKNFILHILKNYVDIVFANQNEAFALTGHPPDEAAVILSTYTPVAVILVGEKGSYVSSNDNHLHIPTLNITPVDTTGAGDLYAAGFLHGYIHGRPLKTCAAWGNLTGGAVIQHVGAEIPEYEWINLRQKMKQH